MKIQLLPQMLQDNKKGFMLVELLLVILTLSTFLLLTPMIHKDVCESKMDYFIKSFKSDMNYAIQYTMSNYTNVIIFFKPNDSQYHITTNYSNVSLKLVHYDTGLLMNSYIINNRIDISRGLVLKSQYFYISCGSIKYKINVYEKSGIINATKQ